MRPWRYGAIWECELDSLADVLIHDEPLRHAVVASRQRQAPPSLYPRLRSWRERVRRLGESQRMTYAEQLAAVVERAIEYSNGL